MQHLATALAIAVSYINTSATEVMIKHLMIISLRLNLLSQNYRPLQMKNEKC